MRSVVRSVPVLSVAVLVLSCRSAGSMDGDAHAGHAASAGENSSAVSQEPTGIPANAPEARARLAASPRHAEWAMIATRVAPGDSVRAWIVYPERRDKAPVVIVIHEIFGLSPWIRGVADQLAADGYIAIAPDLLTSKNIPGSPGDPSPDSARAAIRTLNADVVQRQIAAVGAYGMRLPAAAPRYGIVGFCWGGSTSFMHAVSAPNLGAAVVYYGGSPPNDRLATVRAPVLGLYGENDQRVNATIAGADSALKAMGRSFEQEIYTAAGHGFLRQHDGENGVANAEASRKAWPRTIHWFRRHIGA